MNRYLRRALQSAAFSFVVLAGLAFTRMSWLPALFAGATTGWPGLIMLLVIGGAPFGGYLFLLIFNKRDKWLTEAAGLTGLWIGAFSGSVAGLKLAGVS